MEEYVVLFVGFDNSLGQTIKCKSWDEATDCLHQMMEDNDDTVNDFVKESIQNNNGFHITETGCYHIGGLETYV